VDQNAKSKPIDTMSSLCWPVDVRAHRFFMGRILDCSAADINQCADQHGRASDGIGRWECDLADNSLTWSDEVYDIFGLPRGARIDRNEAVTYYCDHSRAEMERLRAYAIEHNRSFILDAELKPGHGQSRRWMRLLAVPICENGRVVRLRGLKQII
jgi:PAS domain-containing protein